MGLYPLFPNRMSVDRDVHGELVYTYTPMSDSNPNFKSGQSIKLRREDVLHIPGLGFDCLVGYSPIAMARNAVSMTLDCEEYGASFFANGARPGGVLKHPGVLNRMKALYWDGDGFLLLYKRLEDGKFRWPKTPNEVLSLTEQQLRWLMEGLEICQPHAVKKTHPTAII